jgi:hypothetical protein
MKKLGTVRTSKIAAALDDSHSQNTSVDVAAQEVTPAETAHKRGHDQGHGDDTLDEVAVLPDNDGVFIQISDVGAADAARVLLHDHPADVAVEKTLADGIGILIGIGVAVVRAVKAGPPSRAAFDGGRATGGEEDLEGQRSLVARVSPEAMVAGGWDVSVTLAQLSVVARFWTETTH